MKPTLATPPAALLAAEAAAPVWRVWDELSDYAQISAAMEAHVARVAAHEAGEEIWLVEHDHVITMGTSARNDALLHPRSPVLKSPRGGQATYHGPGQRVVYPILDLRKRGRDARAYVHRLEAWIIAALAELGVEGFTRCERVGVWVARPDKGPAHEDKIAAIGVRLRRWVAFHGLAINVSADLSRFGDIVPCGIADPRYGVTSLDDLAAAGLAPASSMAELDKALAATATTLLAR